MSDGRDGLRLDARDRIVFQPVARPDVATEVGNIDVGPLFGLPPVSILRPADFLALRFSFTNLQLTGSGDAPRHLVRRTANRAAYLTGAGEVSGMGDLTLESSRRARGFAVWAALRELGRDGVAELVDRCCRLARRFAGKLADGGAEIANDVVLNQVLVSVGDDTDAIIRKVQDDGTCWLGGTTWRGRRYLRISVSGWSTTEADVDRSAAAILRLAGQ